MDMLPVLGGPVQKSTFEAPMASFATLMQRQASVRRRLSDPSGTSSGGSGRS